MKIMYSTDHHMKGRNPGSRLDNYPQAIMNKVLEFEQACYANNAKQAVFGGDLYDTPRVAFSFINMMSRVLRRMKRRGITCYIVPGNHDLYGYSMDTLEQTAIGVLIAAGLLKVLKRGQSYLHTSAKGVTVELFGREYDKDIDHDPQTDYEITPKHQADWNLLFSHGMLLEKPFHPDVTHSLTKDVVTSADLVANGHYHAGYDVHEENGTIFLNPGSTGRDEICKRQPQYAIITVLRKRLKVEYVEYQCAEKYQDIFDFSANLSAKTHTRYLEAFEQTIQDAVLYESFDAKDVLKQISKSNNVDKKIVTAAQEAMAAAESQTDDNKLDGYIEKKSVIGIAKVELENFEGHAKTVYEPNPTGTTAITGGSDSGKSAGGIRAIRWALYNEPKGSDFIRTGANRATVKVTFTDGSSIERSRTQSDAGTYVVEDGKGGKQEFKGFGNNIPIEVANTHQMPKVEIAPGIERTLNIAYQLDGHFSLTDSPATRASAIGRLTGVHIVDLAIKEKKRELTNLTKEINASTKRVEELDIQLEAYNHLPEMEKEVQRLAIVMKVVDRMQAELTELEAADEVIDKARNEVDKIKSSLKAYKSVSKAQMLLAKAEGDASELRTLTTLSDEYEQSSSQVKRAKKSLEQYAGVANAVKMLKDAEAIGHEIKTLEAMDTQLDEAQQEILGIEQKLTRFQTLQTARDAIDKAEQLVAQVKHLEELTLTMSEIDHQIETLDEATLHQQERQVTAKAKIKSVFKKMGNKCPTCQQDLDEEHMEHVIDAV